MRPAAGALALLVILGAVVFSPMLMMRMAHQAVDWRVLADVGQAYGGISAVLAGLALCGIGVSLVLQQRQARQERMGGERSRHLELIKILIDHPEFLAVVDIDLMRDPRNGLLMYANLSVGHWLAAWELGEIDDEELRGNLRSFFKSPISRDWWESAGPTWISGATAKRRRFTSIMHEEFFAAAVEPQSPPASSDDPRPHRRGVDSRGGGVLVRPSSLLLLAAGAGIGAIAREVFRKRP